MDKFNNHKEVEMYITYEDKKVLIYDLPGFNGRLLHDLPGRVYLLNWGIPKDMPKTPGKRKKVKWTKAQIKYSRYDDLLSLRRGLISAVAKSSKRIFEYREIADVLEKFQDVKFVTHLYAKGSAHQVFIDLQRMDELLSRAKKQPLTEASRQLSAIIAYVDQETSSVNIGVIQCRSVATYERVIEQLKATHHWRHSYVLLISKIDARVNSYKKWLLTCEKNLDSFLDKYLTSIEEMNPKIIEFVVTRMQKNLESFDNALPFESFYIFAEKQLKKIVLLSNQYEFHETTDAILELRARIYYEYLRLSLDRIISLLMSAGSSSKLIKVVKNEITILEGKLDSKKFDTIEEYSMPKFSEIIITLRDAAQALPSDPDRCKALLKSIL